MFLTNTAAYCDATLKTEVNILIVLIQINRLNKLKHFVKKKLKKGFGANFAFLEFEDERDAEVIKLTQSMKFQKHIFNIVIKINYYQDALRAENGKDMFGSSMVVEWAKSKGDRRDRGGRDDRYGGRDSYRSDRGRGGGASRSVECYECGERGHFARDCRNRRGSGRNRIDRDRDGGSRRYGSDRDRDRRSRDRSVSIFFILY